MAGSRLEKLLFTVALIDKASGPASKITGQVDELTKRTHQGMAKVGAGAAGLFATGYALNALLSPAREMGRAIGEVKSLGVADAALKQLESTALSTAIRYGLVATEIVRSSYDIQSAIAGLSNNELSKFTQASAILAKGTKSDAATITDYMGTMYGIFKNTANRMGKAQWVEMLTGQTATAVQMFKTTGAEMAGSFANLGAEAQSAGASMAEQIAILGTLQATMSGSEAGTKYKAFLAGVGNAQDKLGLSFTDSQGRLLPMLDILQKLKGKFGDTFDVAESDALKKAFGSNEATGLIKLLMQDMSGLDKSITDLGNVKGMKAAEKMAMAMADPLDQLNAAGNAIATTFGRVLQPALGPLVVALTEGGARVQRWAELFPNLTRVIGIAVLTIFGLAAGMAALSLFSGVATLVMGSFQTILLAGRLAMLLFNAALWANPITWVVAAVIALVAAIGYAIYKWKEISAAIMETTAFKLLSAAIDFAIGSWDRMKSSLADMGVFKLLGKSLDWIVEKINLIPGIDIETKFSGDAPEGFSQDGVNSAGLIENRVPVGGLQNQINNRGTTVEKMEIHTTGGVSGYQLADELIHAGG